MRYLLYFIAALAFTLICSDHLFFWDSVAQVSVPASYYYDNNFNSLFLPNDISTGHPPFVGMIVAFFWKLFGRSLLVSHLVMFPFIFGILVQIDRIISRSGLGIIDSLLLMTITVCDATLVSQMSMITFDLPHIFFFLLCLNSIAASRKPLLSISFTFLMLTSLRGEMSGFGLILYILIRARKADGKLILKELLPLLPGIIAFITFLLLFFIQKDWVIMNPYSPDFRLFGSFAGIKEVLRNVFVAGWRLVDFGRIGIWMAFLVILFISFRKKTLFDDFFSGIFLAALCQFIVFFTVVILFRNPFGHRYFLPVIILVSVAAGYWILHYSKFRYQYFTLILAILLSGYFWTYPENTSTGWDATPAHWSYFKALKEMAVRIEASAIPEEEIGSYFPIEGEMCLKDPSASCQGYHDASLETDEYILYSNICNLDDNKIAELFNKSRWEEVCSVKSGAVRLVMFRNLALKGK